MPSLEIQSVTTDFWVREIKCIGLVVAVAFICQFEEEQDYSDKDITYSRSMANIKIT